MKKRLPSPEHADTLSLDALRRLVTGSAAQVYSLAAEVQDLRAENAPYARRMQHSPGKHRLKVENQLLRDEIDRLKNLPPRPAF